MQDYFSQNFGVDYILPEVSESKKLRSFWETLISIRETKVKLLPEYSPGTFHEASFYFEGRKFYTVSLAWCKDVKYLSAKSESPTSDHPCHIWTIKKGNCKTSTYFSGKTILESRVTDEETFMKNFSEDFLNSKSQ